MTLHKKNRRLIKSNGWKRRAGKERILRVRIEGFRLRKGFAGTRCTCSARLSQRNVLKPEAANEARREIARNAPPQQRFSQKNETITKNNEAKRKIPDGQIYLPKSGFAFCSDCVTILGKKAKKWHLQWDSNPCCRDENPVS